MGNVVGGMTISLDGLGKGQDSIFSLLCPAFDELMSKSEATTVSPAGCKPQAQGGGAPC